MSKRTILCFGDSNTHGTRAIRHMGDRRRFAAEHRWPNILAARLGAGWDVIAEGHPARTAILDDPVEGSHKSGLRALPVMLESHRPLDLVIVMLGTNDLKPRFSLPAFDIAVGIERLVVAIRQSDAGPDGEAPAVLLAAPVPVEETGFLREMFQGGAAKSRALAPLFAEVAARHSIGFIDLGRVAVADLVDGVHLTAEAHAKIGDAMVGAVRAIGA